MDIIRKAAGENGNVDGVATYHKIFSHYMEMNGEGLAEVCAKLMMPKPAAADELVYQAVIDWEDSYSDAISRGMHDSTYQQRLVVYKKLVTPWLREALILQDFDSEG